LAAAALSNSACYVHGLQAAPLDLRHLHEDHSRVLVLFPSEDAQVLQPPGDDRKITLVVPDGNWRQASRIPRRVPGLAEAERVTLPPGPPTRWGVRKERRPGGLATLEAIARALGILEGPSTQTALERLFSRVSSET
jgi:DTW domain-containing protein YfiP